MQDFFQPRGRGARTAGGDLGILAGQERGCTAGELAQLALGMAQWLHAQQLQEGERFAVLLENRVEILALVLAARHAGLYAAVLNTHLAASEIAYIVQDCGARLVVASRATLPQVAEALQAHLLPQMVEVLQGRPLLCWTVDEATPQAASL